MTAPDVNLEKQKRRHRPSLIGIGVAVTMVAFIAILAAMLNVEDDAAADMVPAATSTLD